MLHDDFFKTLLDMHKKLVDLEEGAGAVSPPMDTLSVLLVDDDGWLGGQLGACWASRVGTSSRRVTGGEALDLAGRERFQIALVKDALTDLPGSMVARTIKSQSPDTIVLLFHAQPRARARARWRSSTRRAPSRSSPRSRAAPARQRLGELGDAYRATNRERRYLASFRQQHFELLKRYAEMKPKLQGARRVGYSSTPMYGRLR